MWLKNLIKIMTKAIRQCLLEYALITSGISRANEVTGQTICLSKSSLPRSNLSFFYFDGMEYINALSSFYRVNFNQNLSRFMVFVLMFRDKVLIGKTKFVRSFCLCRVGTFLGSLVRGAKLLEIDGELKNLAMQGQKASYH